MPKKEKESSPFAKICDFNDFDYIIEEVSKSGYHDYAREMK